MRRIRPNFGRWSAAAAAMACALAVAMPAMGQYREDLTPVGPAVPIPNPEITPKPNAAIPLDLAFTRSDGAKIKLGDLFNQGNKPVILSLVYFSCPNLCGLTQDHLSDAVKVGPRDLVLGKDYDVVVVSIDPDDTPASAAAKRKHYLDMMGKPESQAGFTYLTGSEENIRTLADAVGYGFRRNPDVKDADPSTGKFAHSAGIFICTPYGRLSTTLTNLSFPTDELHYSLIQASDGKIGSGILECVGLPCGAVRLGANGNYEANPWFWAGTAGGGASILFMAVFLGMLWRGEAKRRHAVPPGGQAPENQPTGGDPPEAMPPAQ